MLKLLLAEDNSDDAFLLRQAFAKAKLTHELHQVCDGLEAQAYLKGDRAYADRGQYPFPDVLLLDLNMPRMNGFELLEWLRQDSDCRHLIVHVLTASPRVTDVQRVYGLGANSYVMKPSRMDGLVAFATALDHWHQFLCLPSRPALHHRTKEGSN